MREKMAGDVVAGDVEKVVQAGEEVGGEEGEGVVLDEQLLQVRALLEDGRRQGGQVVVRQVEMGERPKTGEGGQGEHGEMIASQIEVGEAREQREVAREEA